MSLRKTHCINQQNQKFPLSKFQDTMLWCLLNHSQPSLHMLWLQWCHPGAKLKDRCEEWQGLLQNPFSVQIQAAFLCSTEQWIKEITFQVSMNLWLLETQSLDSILLIWCKSLNLSFVKSLGVEIYFSSSVFLEFQHWLKIKENIVVMKSH